MDMGEANAHHNGTARPPVRIPGRLGPAGQLPESDVRRAGPGRTFREYRTGCAVPDADARVARSCGGESIDVVV